MLSHHSTYIRPWIEVALMSILQPLLKDGTQHLKIIRLDLIHLASTSSTYSLDNHSKKNKREKKFDHSIYRNLTIQNV